MTFTARQMQSDVTHMKKTKKCRQLWNSAVHKTQHEYHTVDFTFLTYIFLGTRMIWLRAGSTGRSRNDNSFHKRWEMFNVIINLSRKTLVLVLS